MLIASTLLALGLAQIGPDETPRALQTPGVIPYTAAFFAEAQPSTALDMITRLPGFSPDGGDSVRGFAGAAGNVLINGQRPTTKTDGLEDILRRISASGVERIDLIRGGAPGVDMQGRTVLANVVLKRSIQVERVVKLQTYVYPDGYLGPTLELEASRREGDDELEGSLKATQDRTDQTYDGGRRRRVGADGALISEDALKGYDQIRNYVARGAVQRGALGGKVGLNGKIEYFGIDRTGTAERIVPTTGREQDGDTYGAWFGEFGARYDRPLPRGADLQLVFLQNLGREKVGSTFQAQGLAADYAARIVTGESILRGEIKKRRSETLSFELGTEAAYNLLDGDSRYVENGDLIALPAAKVRVEELRGEASAKAIWRALPRLTLEAGTRLEVSRISQSGDSDLARRFIYPKPRLLATWDATPADQVRLRLEREVGQLDFNDFVSSVTAETGTVDAGNRDLKPSRTWVLEAAWERRFWDGGAVGLTLSHLEITDVVDVIPIQTAFEAPGNLGRGTADTARIDLTLPTARLGLSGGQLKATLDWRGSAVTDPVTGERRRISRQTPFSCDVRFTRDMPGGRWSWGVIAACAEHDTAYRVSEVRVLRRQTWLEGFVEWKPDQDLTLRAELANWNSRSQTRERRLYDQGRGSGAPSQVETRRLPFEPYLSLSVRRRLGGGTGP